MIYIEAFNIFGTKGGGDKYLIDFSIVNGPTFENRLEPIKVSLSSSEDLKPISFSLPKVSPDTNNLKLKDPKVFPFLSANL